MPWTLAPALLALALCAGAAAAQAPPAADIPNRVMPDGKRFQIRPGERVVFTLDDQLRPVIVEVGPEAPEAGLAPPAGTVPDGPLTASLVAAPQGTALVVRNGSGARLDYRAVLAIPTADGVRPAPTSTCTLAPHLTAYETWPQPVPLILVGPFHAAAAVNCAIRPE